MPTRMARRGALAVIASALAAPLAHAFPDRPLRWIVAYPAGGGSDALARLFAQAMQGPLGQTIIVDNRPGAGATIGALAAARAAPDGHTLFSGDSGSMVNNIALFRSLAYDPAADFRGIGLFADFPLVVAVPAASRFRTIGEYFAAARAAPGTIACGTPGVGSPHHMALERMMRDAGISLINVPYRGGAPGVNDLIAGTLESMMVDVASAGGAIRGGRVRALAATSPERWVTLPEVPTLRESGLPEYRAPAWQGLVCPRATPDAIVERLWQALAGVLADQAIRQRLVEIGVAPLSQGPAEFDAMMQADRAFWVPFIRERGITLES